MMVITSVSVENFRNVEHIEIHNADRSVLLLGPNGAGKTSVLEAVRYALFGYCIHTDKRGSGATGLVRDGATQAGIILGLRHGDATYTVGVRIPKKGAVEWTCVDSAGATIGDRDALWHRCGVTREQAVAAGLMYEALLSGSFGDLLTGLLNDAIPVANVAQNAGPHAKWLIGFAGQIAGEMADWYGVGDNAYKLRTERKRGVKELQGEMGAPDETPVVDAKGKTWTAEELPKLRSVIAKLNQERDALLVERGRCGSARKADVIERELSAARTELEKAQAALDTANASLEEYREQVRSLEAEIREAAAMDIRLFNEMERIESLLKVFKDGVCPKCNSKIPKSHLQELTGAERKGLAEVQEQRAEIAKRNAEATEQKTDAIRLSHEAETAYGAAYKRRDECALAVRKLEAEQPAGARSEAEVAADIEVINGKIDRAQHAEKRLSDKANRAGLQKRIDELIAEIEHLDWAVENLKDGKLLKQLMPRGKRESFVAALNAELVPFGYSAHLHQDGKRLVLWLSRAGAVAARPWRDCSDGERCLGEIAAAMAYANSIGAPVLIDNIDRLDGAHKETLRKRLATASTTALMACAWGQRQKPDMAAVAKAFSPAQVLWIDGGMVTAETEVAA